MKLLWWIMAAGMLLQASEPGKSLTTSMPTHLQMDDREAPVLIPYRGGIILKSVYSYMNKTDERRGAYAFSTVANETQAPMRFAIKGLDKVRDVAFSGGQCVALGLRGNELKAMVLAKDGSWNDLTLPGVFTDEARAHDDEVPQIIGSRTAVAILVKDLLCWREGEGWLSRRLPPAPQFYKEIEPWGVGSTQYLDGTQFYAGWDMGEWGGMLAVADVALPVPVWTHLSGRSKADKDGIPGQSCVVAIEGTGKDELWVGLGRGILKTRGLYRHVPGKDWETVIEGEFDEDTGPLRFPVPSELTDVTVDAHGKVFVLASGAGIFEVLPHELRPVLSFDLASPLKARKKGESNEDFVGCYPRYLRIAANGEVFASVSYLGVLAFRQQKGRWEGRQIMLGNDR